MRKIYTKTGDDGTTALLSGKRVPKYHIRVVSYGTIDELSSNIGFLISLNLNENIKEELLEIQRKLFNISGLLACDQGKHLNILKQIEIQDIEFLENSIDKMTSELEPLNKFIIPGGSQEVAFSHICRTVARRAERHIVELSHQEKIYDNIIIFVNRLSDYFFTLARYIAKLNNFEQPTVK